MTPLDSIDFDGFERFLAAQRAVQILPSRDNLILRFWTPSGLGSVMRPRTEPFPTVWLLAAAEEYYLRFLRARGG